MAKYVSSQPDPSFIAAKGETERARGDCEEIRTIKPGSYPGSRNPAHIHARVTPPGGKEQWIDEFLFDGDPFLKKEDHERFATKGTFSSIMKTEKGNDGVLHCVRNIKVNAH